MTIKLGVIMDPIEGIKVSKDSTFAMLLEAQNRGYEITYMLANSLVLKDDKLFAHTAQIQVQDQASNWFELTAPRHLELSALDVVLMRKDPPFNMEYIYHTYLLDRLEETGTLVVNNPTSIRNANEKLFATHFSNCVPPYLVSSQKSQLNKFIDAHEQIVVKPLDGMAGDSIFQIKHDDTNRQVIRRS